MLKQLKAGKGIHAISSLPKHKIKYTARAHGYKVSTITVGYQKIKVRLVKGSDLVAPDPDDTERVDKIRPSQETQ